MVSTFRTLPHNRWLMKKTTCANRHVIPVLSHVCYYIIILPRAAGGVYSFFFDVIPQISLIYLIYLYLGGEEPCWGPTPRDEWCDWSPKSTCDFCTLMRTYYNFFIGKIWKQPLHGQWPINDPYTDFLEFEKHTLTGRTYRIPNDTSAPPPGSQVNILTLYKQTLPCNN